MAYKLVVSDRIEFDVKFSLNDAGEEKSFGVRLAAKRIPREQLTEERDANIPLEKFFAARGLQMLAWIGKSPLIDEESGDPVPPGDDALKALMDMVGGFPMLVYAGFLDANGAKGKAGN